MRGKYLLSFLIISIYLLSSYKSEDCRKERPIKFNNGICEIRNCSQEELENKHCIFSNEKVKIQWINNIIKNVDKKIESLRVVTSSQNLFISSYYFDMVKVIIRY